MLRIGEEVNIHRALIMDREMPDAFFHLLSCFSVLASQLLPLVRVRPEHPVVELYMAGQRSLPARYWARQRELASTAGHSPGISPRRPRVERALTFGSDSIVHRVGV